MRGLDVYSMTRSKAQVLDCGLKVLKTETENKDYKTMYCLQMWKPKAIKPYINYWFRDEFSREKFIQDKITSYQARKAETENRKIERAGTQEQIDSVNVGDIFHFSWGYDQTNCDFYQVIAKRGKMVDIRMIATKRAEKETGNSMADYRLPVKDAFLERESVMTKKLQFMRGKPFLTIASYGWCDLWDGQAQYCSWYA